MMIEVIKKMGEKIQETIKVKRWKSKNVRSNEHI